MRFLGGLECKGLGRRFWCRVWPLAWHGAAQVVIVPLKEDRIWGRWGSDYNITIAIFYLLKGNYNGLGHFMT